MATYSTVKRVTLALSGIFILFCVIGPNIEWVKSPLTPSIKVAIKDANNGKPISNMQVIVSHTIRNVYFPGSGNTNFRNSELTHTNDEGVFYIKRALKPISLSLFGFIDRYYDGTQIMTLNSKYSYQTYLISSDKNIIFNMKLITSASDLKENYDIYNIFKDYNYPSRIKTVIDSARIDLDKKLAAFNKNK